MTKKIDYAAQRLDPRWQKRRLEIMERDDFQCLHCGDKDSTLNVHHEYYIAGRMLWNYPSWSLKTLCWKCHKERHGEELADNEEFSMNEWELELEMLYGGSPDSVIMEVWMFAAELKQAHDDGLSRASILRDATKFIRAIRTALPLK